MRELCMLWGERRRRSTFLSKAVICFRKVQLGSGVECCLMICDTVRGWLWDPQPATIDVSVASVYQEVLNDAFWQSRCWTPSRG